MSRLRSALAQVLSIVVVMMLPAVLAGQTPSGDVVVSSNTTWATGTYNVTSLTVNGGAVLTIGGGSTVTATNAIAVAGNSSIVLQSINNTAQVSGTWQGVGVTLQAGSVQVDSGSSINADGQGYVTNAGPGGGIYGSGGTYGGLGGNADPTIVTTYGVAAMPVDLGSGGGAAQYSGSNGGGQIRLIVSGTIALNGTISANGEIVEPARGGAGSGGAVYVTTNSLTGSGSFLANGGSNTTPNLSGSPAGGGGRVAVYYNNASGFTGFTSTTAAGGIFTGTTTNYAGAAGTAAFFDTSATSETLDIYQNFVIAPNSVSTFNQIMVRNGAVLTIGGGSTITANGSVTVTGNSSIIAQSINNTGKVNGAYIGAGVTLQAGSLQVDAGSSINADAQGYLSSAQRAGDGTSGGSGGSYGGLGGYGPGPIYGSASAPVDLGSGGVAAQYVGSNGGGAIRLIVSGTLTNNGIISANGQAVLPSQGGAGAGGSIYVTTAVLAGSGSFTANGGSNTTPTLSGSAAGGGGRVAIYYSGPTTFTGFATSTASGGIFTGQQTGYAGTSGTTVFFDTSVSNSNVSVYQSGFQIPANSTVQYNSMTVANGSAVTVGNGSTINLSGSLNVTSGAVLTIGGGSTVTVTNGVTVTGNSSIVMQSMNNTGKVNGAFVGVGVTLQAGSVQVDAGSSINADAQGYISSAQRAGNGGSGGSGGSYGGLGGYNPGPIYGLASAPVDLGSGGVAAQYTGSNGGGAVRLIVSGTLTNNGVISANGQAVLPAQGGAGAGGSVYVTTGVLAGSGSFNANGGSNTTPTLSGAAAGGGGRVAVYYNSAANFSGFTTSTATGGVFTGTSIGYAGANGSAAFFDTSVPNSNVSIYQGFDIPAGTNVQYNGLNVASGASVSVGGGSQIVVTQAMRVTGTITASAINNTGTVASKYVGKGIIIAAGSLQIDATGSINADSQGYPANVGPGAGSYTSGGSYGGLGGQQASNTLYGSAAAPVDLGSGGGSGQNTGGGSGGGAIELLVGGTFTHNGTISANGGSVSQSGYGAGGSGGSVFVQTSILQGTGTITANGGSNTLANNAGSGGGGGRIAVDYVTNSGFNQSSLQVNAGTGNNLGAAGTIQFVQGAPLEFIKPTASVVHGVTPVQFFTSIGVTTTVTEAGPQNSTLAVAPAGIGSTTWDTTTVPDGSYELRLQTTDSTGMIYQLSKNVVVNNSVQWYSGTLTTNTHWTAGNVYAIDFNLIIPQGITLTIDPGTVVKALAGSAIIVQSGGTLIATGNPGSQVVFTTFDDSSVGGNTDFNQGVTLPLPGEWDGISVNSGGTFTQNNNTVVHYAGQQVPLTLTSDTTLVSTQVYEISGLLTVSNGATLTIQPGTVIKFDSGAGISMQSGTTLIANGTLSQPIYFTSINDTSVGGITNNNTGTTPPAPGDWNSIAFNGANGSFKYAQIQYGGGPATANFQGEMIATSDNSNVTISDSVLAYSYYIGINTGYQGGGDTVTISNTTFYGIEDRPINALGGSTVHVVNSTFEGNAYGVLAHGGNIDVANSVISNSIGSRFTAVENGGGTLTIVNSDVYSTVPGNLNYSGMADQTGLNGNISAAPVYMNAALHDYHPTYGSPLIDAASAAVPNYPATDAYGVPRNNSPLVTAKTGTPDSSGKYPDIGALEFAQAASSDLDLTVTAVQGPSATVVGSQASLTWTITNVGSGTVYGPWHDGIYLVTDPDTNPVETLAGTLPEGAGIVLGPGASYSASGTVTVPGTTVGPHVWEVRTNVKGEVFEGVNTANNKAISLQPVSVTLNQLVTGAAPLTGSFLSAGQYSYYSFTATPSQATKIQLALASGVTGSVQLFVGGGYIPSPQRYDYQQTEFNSPAAAVVLPSGTAQTYYIAAYSQNLPAVPAGFTIQATVVQFSLTSLSPNTAIAFPDSVASNSTTLTFIGGGFNSATAFAIIGPNGTAYTPSSVFLTDSDHAEATFALSGLPSGLYSARVIGGSTITLANALTVGGAPNTAGPSTFQATLSTPTGFRAGFPAIVTLNYVNQAGYDIPAPLVYVSATGATLTELAPACSGCDPNFATKRGNTFNSGVVLAINQQGPAGVLPAGASGSISFLAAPENADVVTFYVATQGTDPVNTTFTNICTSGCVLYVPKISGAYGTGVEFCNSLVPAGANVEGYNRACMEFLNNSGLTLKQFINYFSGGGTLGSSNYSQLTFEAFNNAIAADATALSKSGIYEYDLQSLLNFELQKDGSASLNLRYHQGAFGFGPSHPFDITLSNGTGSPAISFPEGITRTFTRLTTASGIVFLGTNGDYGTLTLNADNSYLLAEPDGTTLHFTSSPGASNYLLDYIADRTGNKTALNYTNNLLTTVVNPVGDTLKFQYDDLGHIVQVTDATGRIVTYTYNILSDSQHSTFLTSYTNAKGTTTLTWNQGGSHGVGYIDDSCVATYCEPAIGITSAAYPDGTHTNYTYDAVGRIASISRDGGAQSVTYTYNSDGSVQKTDALGKSTLTIPNQIGQPATLVDALSAVTHFKYDPESKLIGEIGPLGDSSAIGYDTMGNVDSVTSPIGSLANLVFTSDASPTSFTDPSGNAMMFNYDSVFNLTSTVFPNDQAVTYTYDSFGRIITRTNRRNQTVTYTYGPHSLLASKTFSNGSQAQYTYDSDFNLATATTASGTTHLLYDAADRVTSITNADGTYLAYTYNSNGQRISMKDSTGFVTNFTYDQVGRLATVNNASNAVIVTYTYDGNGRLTKKAFANGTSTSLTYDASGNATSVINYSPAHAILSEYDYTYDSENHLIGSTTPTGNLTYGYDLDGQLTSVTTPSGVIQYNYDASGNRTNVTTNGAASNYLVNNLNAYTSANGVNYQYDTDGNLISGNGWTYTYNDDGRLLTMANSTDSWSFQYDGLGYRVGSIHNGQQKRYVIDPGGYGDVEAELDGTGAVIAHYTYGLDLTSTVQASGTTGYYHFDASGNTTQVTTSTGTVADSYVYLPFGEKTVLSSAIPNPFTFNGQVGVRDEGSGLYFMRNRWYSPQLGRFTQLDPIGFAGGQNFYQFVHNSPLDFTDPLGLDFVSDFSDTMGGHALNGLGGEIPGLGGFVGGTASNIVTLNSLANNFNNHDTAGVIHDTTLAVARQIGLFLPSKLAPGPLGVLQGVIKHIGLIDEISNSVFNDFFDGYYGNPPRACSFCLFRPADPDRVPINAAVDPNAKITSGFGDQGFIPTGSPVTYTIYFENQPTATAPAQKVSVTDQLSSNLDWSTVQLNQVSFNNVTLNVPEATQAYTTQANVSTDPNPVNVVSSLNPTTGLLTLKIQSVDAITGGTPANPLAGFLPPNNSANAGTGFVTFTVAPKKALANAATITNQASIVFDANAAINTNIVTNTIDSSTPISAVSLLPASTSATSFTVSWSGSDPSGSGVASYNIYVTIDGATPTLWLSGTALTSSTYTATAGHTYGFFSLATNNVGVTQSTPSTTQTITVNYIIPTVTVTPAALAITPTQSLTVNVAVTTSTFVPTGTVILQSGAYSSTAVTLAAGLASFTIPAGTLANGTDSLTVSYTPDTPGTLFYAKSSGSANVTVGSVGSFQVTVSAPGAAFSVDGTSYTTAQTLSWIPGSSHTLATTSPQITAGTQETFVSWSDGGALTHTVTATSTVTTYKAAFSTAYLLTTAAAPVAGGTVLPANGTYYPAGTTVNLTATPTSGYSFSNWTGSVANSSTAATTITLNAPQTVTANFTVTTAPVVTLTPSALTFTALAGATSTAQTVLLKNTGTAALTISGVSITGTNSTSFAQTNPCVTTLAINASCSISVTFTATAAGTYSATLSITDNATGSPQTVSLAGTATATPTFTLSATPASQTVLPGITASYTINAAPQNGSFANAVTLSVTGLPSGTTAAFTPSTLTPGSAGATSVLTIQTAPGFASLRTSSWSTNAPAIAALGFCFLGALRRRKRWAGTLFALFLIAFVATLSGCASRQQPTTSTITITGTSGTIVQTTTVSLTIQ